MSRSNSQTVLPQRRRGSSTTLLSYDLVKTRPTYPPPKNTGFRPTTPVPVKSDPPKTISQARGNNPERPRSAIRPLSGNIFMRHSSKRGGWIAKAYPEQHTSFSQTNLDLQEPLTEGNLECESLDSFFDDEFEEHDKLGLLLSCNTLGVESKATKQDWVSGEIDIPEFHCPRCRDHWYGIRSVPCDEELARLIREGLWKTGNTGDDSTQKTKLRDGRFNLTKSSDRNLSQSNSQNRAKFTGVKQTQFLTKNSSGSSSWDMKRPEEGEKKKKKRITFQLDEGDGEDSGGGGAGGQGRGGQGRGLGRHGNVWEESTGGSGGGDGEDAGSGEGRGVAGGGAGGGALESGGDWREGGGIGGVRDGSKTDSGAGGLRNDGQNLLGGEEGGTRLSGGHDSSLGSGVGGGSGDAKGSHQRASQGSDMLGVGGLGSGLKTGGGGDGDGGGSEHGDHSKLGSGLEGAGGSDDMKGREGGLSGSGNDNTGLGKEGGDSNKSRHKRERSKSRNGAGTATAKNDTGDAFTKPVDHGKKVRKNGGYMRAINPTSSEWGDPLHAHSFISSTATSRMGSHSNLADLEDDGKAFSTTDIDSRRGKSFLPPIVHPIKRPPPIATMDFIMGPVITRPWTFSYH